MPTLDFSLFCASQMFPENDDYIRGKKDEQLKTVYKVQWVNRGKIQEDFGPFGPCNPVLIMHFSLLCGNQISAGNNDHIRKVMGKMIHIKCTEYWAIRHQIKTDLMHYNPVPTLNFSLPWKNQISSGNNDHIRKVSSKTDHVV